MATEYDWIHWLEEFESLVGIAPDTLLVHIGLAFVGLGVVFWAAPGTDSDSPKKVALLGAGFAILGWGFGWFIEAFLYLMEGS